MTTTSSPRLLRETQHYRVHTLYRPKPWATISAAYNDLERHNNTNNTGARLRCRPLGSRRSQPGSELGADLMPNEHYGLDFNYAYSDVYTATNICFWVCSAMPAAPLRLVLQPRAAFEPQAPCDTVAPPSHGSAVISSGRPGISRDAPTQYVSAAVTCRPTRSSAPISATASAM